jgi:hypothetical protein
LEKADSNEFSNKSFGTNSNAARKNVLLVKESNCSGELGLGCILKKNRTLQETLLEYQDREVSYRKTISNLCKILDSHKIKYDIDETLLSEMKGLVPIEQSKSPLTRETQVNSNRPSKGIYNLSEK